LIAAHCLSARAGYLAVTVLAGQLQSLSHWQRKGNGGVEPALWLTAARKCGA